MQTIRLITFDVFGTLLDWQSYVEQAFPNLYPDFLGASEERQQPGRAVFPYRSLLFEVGQELRPRTSREALNFFADGFGYAKPFTDARAVQHLSHMAMLGVVSNCDFRHLIDVQKTLGCVFDVTLPAEELRAYKPHPEAWDQVFEHVTRKLGFERQSWLHVSAYADFDLAPAKERGIVTCFLPRPGGTPAADVQALAPDYQVSDLWELCKVVAGINGAPVRYVVKATVSGDAVAQDFLSWMRYEHGPELLQIKACQQFQVLRSGPNEILCEYVFTNKAALDDYFAGPAQELRRKGRERYPEDAVRFERAEATLAAGYRQRARSDFPTARKS